MPASAEFGGEPGFEDLFGQGFADQPGAQGEQVGVIVLAGIGGGGEVIAHAGAHAGDLVGGHAGADPGPVDHDPAEGFTRRNQFGNRPGKIGVIHRGGGIGAAVDDRVAQLGEIGFEGFLEGETAVISADGDRFFVREGGGCEPEPGGGWRSPSGRSR